MDEKLDFDPFELMGLTETCTDKDVISAFRKLALKWHPDKNPDKPELANRMFLKMQKAFEILTDSAAKSALVRLRRARESQKARVKKMDVKRQKLREELEAREKAAAQEKSEEQTCQKQYQTEVNRLRKEGSKKLWQQERERLEKELARERQKMFNRPVDPDDDLEGVEGESYSNLNTSDNNRNTTNSYQNSNSSTNVQQSSIKSTVPISNVTGSDFESYVLSRLKQAEERKCLEQQLLDEDKKTAEN